MYLISMVWAWDENTKISAACPNAAQYTFQFVNIGHIGPLQHNEKATDPRKKFIHIILKKPLCHWLHQLHNKKVRNSQLLIFEKMGWFGRQTSGQPIFFKY